MTFKHATAASTAVEMFNDFKIAGRRLLVKLSEGASNNNNKSNFNRNAKESFQTQTYLEKTKKDTTLSDDGFTDINDLSNDSFRNESIKRSLAGRGSLIRSHDKKEIPKSKKLNSKLLLTLLHLSKV